MREIYCMGDIQGCRAELDDLLAHMDFSPSRHTLYVLGDLVNRGPDSVGVLRRLVQLQGSVHCLLGNHDFHLLAVAQGLRKLGQRDTVQDVLLAHDAATLLDWLRHQPLALYANNCLMVHAGVQPQWDVQQTLACAQEVSTELQSAHWREFLAHLFGNSPDCWDDGLDGMARSRVIVNTLTRIRFLYPDGRMDFAHKRGLEETPDELLPWFAHPLRRTADCTVAFGHWSALGGLKRRNLVALDTGCVWGGYLTAVSIDEHGLPGALIQVPSRTQARIQDE